jgi:peptidoglycan hydrolase CwlO-like protein
MTNKPNPIHLMKAIEEDIKSIPLLKARIEEIMKEIAIVQTRISEKQDLLKNRQRELEDEIKKL